MAHIPRTRSFDSSMALASAGYMFIAKRRQRYRTDADRRAEL